VEKKVTLKSTKTLRERQDERSKSANGGENNAESNFVDVRGGPLKTKRDAKRQRPLSARMRRKGTMSNLSKGGTWSASQVTSIPKIVMTFMWKRGTRSRTKKRRRGDSRSGSSLSP